MEEIVIITKENVSISQKTLDNLKFVKFSEEFETYGEVIEYLAAQYIISNEKHQRKVSESLSNI